MDPRVAAVLRDPDPDDPTQRFLSPLMRYLIRRPRTWLELVDRGLVEAFVGARVIHESDARAQKLLAGGRPPWYRSGP